MVRTEGPWDIMAYIEHCSRAPLVEHEEWTTLSKWVKPEIKMTKEEKRSSSAREDLLFIKVGSNSLKQNKKANHISYKYHKLCCVGMCVCMCVHVCVSRCVRMRARVCGCVCVFMQRVHKA